MKILEYFGLMNSLANLCLLNLGLVLQEND